MVKKIYGLGSRRWSVDIIFGGKLGKSTMMFSVRAKTSSENFNDCRQSKFSKLKSTAFSSSPNVGIERPRKNDRNDFKVFDATK